MEHRRNIKMALLAASSLLTAAAVLTPAKAGELDPAAYPAIVDARVVQEDAGPARPFVGAVVIAAGLAAAGWLVRMLGAENVMNAVKTTAEATVKVSKAVAKAAVKTVRSPLRYLALMGGLALFALTGFGLFDFEWLGGFLTGAVMTGLGVYGASRFRNFFQPALSRVGLKRA